MSENILFQTRPTLRRAYATCIVYAILLVACRYAIALVGPYEWILLPLLILVILRLFIATIKDYFIVYKLTDQYVELKEGIFSRKEKRAPWLRITNFASEQGFIDRLLGIAHVRIDTPGHDIWEIEFTNLTQQQAAAIIDLLTEYAPDAKGADEAIS